MQEIKDNKKSFFYILKKSERLVTAIYKVTDLVREPDPASSYLRELAVELHKDILKMSYNSHTAQVPERVFMILELLTLLEELGLLSSMNVDILRGEYLQLGERVPTRFSSAKEQSPQKRSWNAMISSIENYQKLHAPYAKELTEYIGQIDEKDIQDVETEQGHTSSKMTYKSPFESNEFKSEKKEVKRTEQENQDQNVFKHNDRKAAILGLLQKKQHITIRDVSAIVKDVSEKTLQRELLSMVDSGLLKKEGERRWSTYSLAIG